MNREDRLELLDKRRILLGVTGGIACYKSCELIRRLRDQGAEIRVAMTAGAQAFVTPMTYQALSGNPVHRDLLDERAEAAMGHIELAKWADLVLVAPATANFIERLAQGRGDDLLSTICLATTAPIAVAPAMNQAMWSNLATGRNIEMLRTRRVSILGPGSGSQACGDLGEGRMLEPAEILDLSAGLFTTGPLTGKRVMVTAGPTREAVDPARYLSNQSSGKMGYALAEAAVAAGAHTVLVSGPVSLDCPARVNLVQVESAEDMLGAVMTEIASTDLFIACAAVADYRPARRQAQKIKKNEDRMTLDLVKTPDILNTVGHLENRPFCVGFAAESNNLLDYARDKLERKNIDLIIANDISRQDIGFGQNDNEVFLLSRDHTRHFTKTPKHALASELIDEICAIWNTEQRTLARPGFPR